MGDGIIGIDDGLALTASSDFDVANGSKKLVGRIAASLKSPTLIGKSGYRQRYLRVQWWVVFWRLLILVQIPEVALIYLERFTSVPKAFLLLGIGTAYALLYGYLASRTRLSGTGFLHLADLCICSLLMLISFDEKLIFIMMFYSYSSLLARPTVLLREAAPATVVLSLAYLAASALIGHLPLDICSPAVPGSLSELGNALRLIHQGHRPPLSPAFERVMQRMIKGDLDDQPPYGLTKREFKVLWLMSRGMIDNDIAITVSLSRRQINRENGSIFSKLGVDNRTQASAKAFNEKLFDLYPMD